MSEYPTLWPETIRALLIHSAEWNSVMRRNQELNSMNVNDKTFLLRRFGYGVPDIDRARYSLKNSLTLIAEGELQPFKKDGSVKYNGVHLYELPWPKSVLQTEVGDQDATLKVSLSYFIEPNPGNRLYSNTFSYQSHGLGFRVVGRNEGLEVFLKRISADTRERDEDGKLENGFTAEQWLIGSQTREKGSIQKDFITMSGSEMAERNIIAIFPKSGWYKTRKNQERYTLPLRYSLVLSIETPKSDVDIYTPVLTQIKTPILI
jgi:hypothetical protein